MSSSRIAIYYDGDCPLCRGYTRLTRIRETVGPVRIVNLREAPDAVARFAELGFNVDNGFVVETDGRAYHGADAIHALALLTELNGAFNRLSMAIFSRPRLAAVVYPLLVKGRAALLWMLRRRRLLVPGHLPTRVREDSPEDASESRSRLNSCASARASG